MMKKHDQYYLAFLALAPIGLYLIFLALLAIPWIQKQAIYAHNIRTPWSNVDDPESWGFGKNQVTILKIKTPDGETLYAWHILPRALYAKHEDELASLDLGHITNFKDSPAFKFLTEDPNSKLIINFHGNAGHLLQNQRLYVYKSYSTLSSTTHVLAFSYRGFGRSTGSPSEPGLITDGASVVDYALNDLGIPASRIALVGQSLGTAVLSGVVEHFGTRTAPVRDFATVMLISGFRDMRSNLLGYKMGGVVPVLSPLGLFPGLQKLFVLAVRERWDSNGRLRAVIERAMEDDKAGVERSFKLQIVHAIDDPDIPYAGSAEMFGDLLQLGRSGLGHEPEGDDVGSLESGSVRRSAVWPGVSLELSLLRCGGHNAIVTDTPVASALSRSLGLLDSLTAISTEVPRYPRPCDA